MTNIFWTILPFVLTFTVAAWTPQPEQPEPARRKSGPCLG